jgi:MFS family permease
MGEMIKTPKRKKTSWFSILKLYGGPFLGIFFAAGFSYTTYSFAFTLMNGFIPLVTFVSKTEVMQLNTILLLYDMLCLPLMGYLATRLGKEKVMIAGSVCSALFAIPMFSLLDCASPGTIMGVRIAMITFGVAFSAPYYAWAIERVPPPHRYFILSLGGALGSQLIGMPTSAICLWLYQTFGLSWTPGLYLQITSIMGGLSVFLFMRKESIPAFQSKRILKG